MGSLGRSTTDLSFHLPCNGQRPGHAICLGRSTTDLSFHRFHANALDGLAVDVSVVQRPISRSTATRAPSSPRARSHVSVVQRPISRSTRGSEILATFKQLAIATRAVLFLRHLRHSVPTTPPFTDLSIFLFSWIKAAPASTGRYSAITGALAPSVGGEIRERHCNYHVLWVRELRVTPLNHDVPRAVDQIGQIPKA
jgi:hypothetical protein